MSFGAMPSKLLPKSTWRNAVGASEKPKRLHLRPDEEGLFHCPIKHCDSNPYTTQRGCRKHVYQRHGWYYFFDVKPIVEDVLPLFSTRIATINKPKRSSTSNMPMFLKTCRSYKTFKRWLQSPAGGSKSESQADQIASRFMKFAKFCCDDVSEAWEIPDTVVDYCLGSVTLISDFIEYLREQWKVGYAGVISYMNSLSHMLDFRRTNDQKSNNVAAFIASEIYIQRVKKSLAKKMRAEWTFLLSVEYLSSINCWASLEDLQQVIPFHADRFTQVLLNCSDENCSIPSHDLSFCTSYIIVVLFLMVKASRPMTYQFLTVRMIENVGEDGYIDQTKFKTSDKYGFDTLIFSKQVIDIINGYITCVRPRLHPTCAYLLLSRNGNQLTRLSDIFGRMVFQAIGKYIHPTRYRQIIETESAQRLSMDDQHALSQDQKHTSLVAKVHYQKMNSRVVAEKGKESMDKLRDEKDSINAISKITERISIAEDERMDFHVERSCQSPSEELQEEINSKKDTTSQVSNKRKKKVPFSEIEDKFLLAGIHKHGNGK